MSFSLSVSLSVFQSPAHSPVHEVWWLIEHRRMSCTTDKYTVFHAHAQTYVLYFCGKQFIYLDFSPVLGSKWVPQVVVLLAIS